MKRRLSMRYLLMPLVLLLCGCQKETSVQLWIQNRTDDTLVVEVSRLHMAYMPVREFIFASIALSVPCSCCRADA